MKTSKIMKKTLAFLLVLVFTLSFNMSVFAADMESDITPDTYVVNVNGVDYELEEGQKIEIPIVGVQNPTTRGSGSMDTTIGNVGMLGVWTNDHNFYWNINMWVPATSFSGLVSGTDLNSGLSIGNIPVSGFSGWVYAARISGHRYTASLSGVAYFLGNVVGTTKSNRVTWTC